MKNGKQILALTLALLAALALSGCGSSGKQSGAEKNSVTSCAASAPAERTGTESSSGSDASSAPGDGTDVTADYEKQLEGTYNDDYGARYIFSKGGKLKNMEKVDNKTETTTGEWWVWKQGNQVFLYTSLQGTAHPARYTFSVTDKGVLSLYDDTTHELVNLLTPSK